MGKKEIEFWKMLFWLETIRLKIEGTMHKYCTVVGKLFPAGLGLWILKLL